MQGDIKNCDFRPISRFIAEMIQDRAILTVVYRMAPFSMTLNKPYPSFQGHAMLWRWISHKQAIVVTKYD